MQDGAQASSKAAKSTSKLGGRPLYASQRLHFELSIPYISMYFSHQSMQCSAKYWQGVTICFMDMLTYKFQGSVFVIIVFFNNGNV